MLLTINCNKLCHKFKFCSVKIFNRNFTHLKKPTILGIETSCDDTGCAVVNNEGVILGDTLYSQNALHLRYGGVNPVNAWELHRDNIELAVGDTIKSARLNLNDIDAIAVTVKPGLLLCLKIGVKYANFLAKRYNKPILPIHHMEAHALVARMYYDIPFPYLTLLISGGHCLIAVVLDVNHFLLLGQTLDNAPGEIMDKAARRMKLRNICNYSTVSGGRAIELAALNATTSDMFEFPVPLQKNRDCNFSFSGLKDSLVRKLIKKELEHGLMGDEVIPEIYNLCASFQTSIATHLAHRLVRAIKFCEIKNLLQFQTKNIIVSGGVACNDFIYKCLGSVSNKYGYNLYRPPHEVCTDNGIMIAWNGMERLKKGIHSVTSISTSDIDPNAPFGVNIIDQVKETNLPVRTPIFQKICVDK